MSIPYESFLLAPSSRAAEDAFTSLVSIPPSYGSSVDVTCFPARAPPVMGRRIRAPTRLRAQSPCGVDRQTHRRDVVTRRRAVLTYRSRTRLVDSANGIHPPMRPWVTVVALDSRSSADARTIVCYATRSGATSSWLFRHETVIIGDTPFGWILPSDNWQVVVRPAQRGKYTRGPRCFKGMPWERK